MKIHPRVSKCLILITALLLSSSALAGWMAIADFSSCPRQYIPETSGKEGPFASETDCNARLNQVRGSLACARYSCKNETGSADNSTGTPAAPGHEMDKSISDAIAAGMTGKISGSDAVGLVGMGVLGNMILAPARQLTPQELAEQQEEERQRRIQAEARRQEQEKQKREKIAKLDLTANQQLSLLDAPFNQEQPITHDSQPSKKCLPGEAGLGDFVCHVTVCGGAYNGASVCCPAGYPKLNECDCQCYPNDSHFECMRYAACNNSADFNKPAKESEKSK